MKKISINKGKLILEQNIVGFFQKKVTKFGTGAKVDCPKEFIDRRVYLIICRD